MIRKLVLVVLFTFFPIFFGGAAQAVPIALNNFTNGLNGWIAQDVVVDNGIAELHDSNGYSLLYTGVNVTPGSTYSLSFDFATGVNGAPGYVIDDLFAVTIFFGSTNNFDYTLPAVMLVDNNAGSNFVHNGTVNLISGSPGWSHYTYAFSASDAWLFPVFELFDYDLLVNSTAYINNISLEQTETLPVPEPSTILLLTVGLAGIGLLSKRKR